MAQVSIQYSFHRAIDAHENKDIKHFLDAYPGVKSVSVNQDSGIVCVDYDDTGVCQKDLEEAFTHHDFDFTLIDKIIF